MSEPGSRSDQWATKQVVEHLSAKGFTLSKGATQQLQELIAQGQERVASSTGRGGAGNRTLSGNMETIGDHAGGMIEHDVNDLANALAREAASRRITGLVDEADFAHLRASICPLFPWC